MSSARPVALLALALCACGLRHPRPRVEPLPAPAPTNDDPSCLPVPLVESPASSRAKAEMLMPLIKATDSGSPDMSPLLVRLAQQNFAGGNVAGGCKVAEVATRFGQAADIATATELRMKHCYDGRAQRCTGWYAGG